MGRQIRRVRVDNAMTQQAFALRIGVNPSYIGPLEKGLKSPSISTLERISQEFSVPIFSFFIDEEVEDQPTAERIRVLVTARPPDERQFLLKTLEEMVKLLRKKPRKASRV
ncbi:MAG: helix-turn-helix transcriptional regulator [Candidatus Eremiobacterota bacterium]